MKKYLILVPILFLFSCASELYQPINSSEKTSVENLKKGRATYVNKCSTCHQLRLPKKYDDKHWEIILNKMQPKAKISDEEKLLIYDYIINAPKKIIP